MNTILVAVIFIPLLKTGGPEKTRSRAVSRFVEECTGLVF